MVRATFPLPAPSEMFKPWTFGLQRDAAGPKQRVFLGWRSRRLPRRPARCAPRVGADRRRRARHARNVRELSAHAAGPVSAPQCSAPCARRRPGRRRTVAFCKVSTIMTTVSLCLRETEWARAPVTHSGLALSSTHLSSTHRTIGSAAPSSAPSTSFMMSSYRACSLPCLSVMRTYSSNLTQPSAPGIFASK